MAVAIAVPFETAASPSDWMGGLKFAAGVAEIGAGIGLAALSTLPDITGPEWLPVTAAGGVAGRSLVMEGLLRAGLASAGTALAVQGTRALSSQTGGGGAGTDANADSAPEANNGDVQSPQGSKRLEYLGRTPGKGSRTGQEVMGRMMTEGILRDNAASGAEVSYGNAWYPLENTDMGHIQDAVSWWNRVGRYFGPKSKAVRAWMLNSDNYALEPSTINRSRGGSMSETYLDPIEQGPSGG